MRVDFLVVAIFALLLLATMASAVHAQAPGRTAPPPKQTEQGPRWAELKPAQQQALGPLEREWAGIDATGKQKWLQLSGRFPKLTPTEQARVQERMSAWTRLSPRERGEARLQFQEAKRLPAQDRQARWKAYEALSPEQRQALADRAAPERVGSENARRRPENRLRDPADGSSAQVKSNIVPNPALAGLPRPVTSTETQARAGATTSPVTRRPTPPVHQQTGMPKIAATPEFVDRATLLPQRGPQGAAIRTQPPATADAGSRP